MSAADSGEAAAELLEVGRSFAQTYQPVLNTGGWRVAMLRFFEVVDPARLERAERHRLTDEVFVLTCGAAQLLLFGRGDTPQHPQVVSLEPQVAYNVRLGVWHHITLSPDAHLVIFERDDTGPQNTDYAALTPQQRSAVQRAPGYSP